MIIIDTREKDPWTFEGYPEAPQVRTGTLRSGDYSLEGFQASGVAVERKSAADLFGSMTKGRLRLYNELRRLSGFGLAALVVEASETTLLRGSARTRINPGRMVRTLYEWAARFGVQLHFCDGRRLAERKAYRLLTGWADSRGA